MRSGVTCAEIEAADIEIAAHEESLIVRNRRARRTHSQTNSGSAQPAYSGPLFMRLVKAIVHRRPEIVHCAAQEAARDIRTSSTKLDPLVGLIAGPFVWLKLKLGINVCAWKFENPPPPCDEMND